VIEDRIGLDFRQDVMVPRHATLFTFQNTGIASDYVLPTGAGLKPDPAALLLLQAAGRVPT
jgi:hypothetical protein